MRILYVTYDLSGGVGEVVLSQADELLRRGHHVETWSLTRDSFISCRKFNWIGPRQFGFSPQMFWALYQFRDKFDLMHFHGCWTFVTILAILWTKLLNKPLIYSLHGALRTQALKRSSFKKKIVWFLFQRAALKAATVIQILSEFEGDDLNRIGLLRETVQIPNGLPLRYFNEIKYHSLRMREKLTDHGRRLIYLGRIHPSKGIINLLESLFVLNPKRWMLQIIGSGSPEYEEQLRDAIKRYGLQEYVRLSGELRGEKKIEALLTSDVLVLPTLTEGFPLVILEALAAGIPVITTKETPFTWIEKVGCGWWIDTGVQPLIEILTRVLSLSTTELHERGQLGQSYVKEHYLLESVVDKLEDVYQSVLNYS